MTPLPCEYELLALAILGGCNERAASARLGTGGIPMFMLVPLFLMFLILALILFGALFMTGGGMMPFCSLFCV